MAANFGGRITLEGADQYKRDMAGVVSELKLYTKEAQTNGKSVENASKQVELYNRQIQLQKERIESIEKALKQENAAAEKNVDNIAKLEKMLNNAKTTLAGMEQGLKNAQAELDGLNSKSQKAAEGLKKTGDKLTEIGDKAKGFSAAMTAVAGGSAKLASDFESSFARVSTLVTDTDINLQALAEDTRKLSSEINVSSTELNEAFYSALSAGVEMTADYGDTLGFLEQNSKLATAGFTDMQTAIDTTTTILNAYGMELDETSRIHETLVNTQNLGKTTVAQLGASLSQVIPTAASLGISVEQIGAAFAAMTAQGIPTAQAATQIRSALSELSKEGQTAYTNFENLAGKSFKDFIAGGGTMSEAMKILADGAKAAGAEVNSMFGSVEAANTALVLAGETGFAKFNESLLRMEGSVGVVDEAFEKMADTAEYKMTKALNELKNAGSELGQSLLPVVTDFAGNVSKFAEWFSGLSDSTKKAIANFVLFGAALAPISLGLGKTITAVSQLLPLLGKLKTALEALSKADTTLLVVTAALAAFNAAFAINEKRLAENTTALNEINTALSEQAQKYSEAKARIDEKVESENAELDVTRMLASRYEELAKKTERTKQEDFELEGIIKKLNEKYPDLGLAIDGTTESINDQIKAIDELIKAQEREMEAAEALEKKRAASKNVSGTNEVRWAARSNVTAAMQALGDKDRQALQYVITEYNKGKINPQAVDAVVKALKDNPQFKDVNFEAIRNFQKALQDAQLAESRYAQAVSDFNKAQEEYKNAFSAQFNTVGGGMGAAAGAKVSDISDLDENVKKGLETWKYRLDRGIITEQEYYTNLERIRDTYFEKDSKAWRDYDLQIYNWKKSRDEKKAETSTAAASSAAKSSQEILDLAKENIEAARKAYSDAQAHSYDWISERVYREDFGDFGTSAKESYDRIYRRALEAYKAEVISFDEFAAEADKIKAAKLADYKTEKQKMQNFIDDRNFYDDWSAVNSSEEKVLRQMLDNADRYYTEGILGYKEYMEEVRQLNRSIYTAQATEQENILQAAQDRVQRQLDEKRAEIDEQISVLNKQVSDLRASYTTRDRQKRLAELKDEIQDYSHAVTLQGQEHLKSLQEEQERLLREQEIEDLQRKNNEMIEQLEAEYRALEVEKTSLLAKIEENTSQYAQVLETLNGLGAVLENAVAASFQRVFNDNSVSNNYNTNNVTQTNMLSSAADVLAVFKPMLRTLRG